MANIKNIIKLKNIAPIITGIIAGVILFEILAPQIINAEFETPAPVAISIKLVKNGKLTVCKINKEAYETIKKIKMIITAYSSTPDQTDSTPFITASGKQVSDGIIANNLLPFGTKVRIPQLFGDKIFIVEDRMHSRKGKYHADIWMSETSQAKNFGAKITEIEIVES